MAPLVVIAAGGTGGHLFPAEALAGAFKRRKYRTVLVTDKRVGELAKDFPAESVICLASATPSGRSLLHLVKAFFLLGWGFLTALFVLKRLKPDMVVGFGGYPTAPPVLAASLLGIPTIIHEQNGVMGRANRFLAKRAQLIATGFPTVRGIPPSASDKSVHVGNPLRAAVLAAAKVPYPAVVAGGKMRILAFGGSQGAHVMSEVVPAAIDLLPREVFSRLVIVQQAREDDLLSVRQYYSRLILAVEAQPFFEDLPRRIADAHLVIARSGASTVAELAAIGRPSILVPLPGAIDQDQATNAASLSEIGAALVIAQDDFTPQRLAKEIMLRFERPELLIAAAQAAKGAGRTDAAERLADLVMKLAQPGKAG